MKRKYDDLFKTHPSTWAYRQGLRLDGIIGLFGMTNDERIAAAITELRRIRGFDDPSFGEDVNDFSQDVGFTRDELIQMGSPNAE